MNRAQLRCRHRGVVDLLAGSGEEPVFDCAVHETCAPSVCARCEDAEALPLTQYQASRERRAFVAHATKVVNAVRGHGRKALERERGWGWFSLARAANDVRDLLLPKCLELGIDAVAGVPRSGMVAASQLALLLHAPLYRAHRDGVAPIGSGGRGTMSHMKFAEPRRTLILEDSIYGGTSLGSIRRALGDGYVYGALYARPAAMERAGADVVGLELESPHFFEWHFFNSGHMDGRMSHPGLQGGSVLDMDGIVCHDPDVPDEPEDDYVDWMRRARPRWLPRTIPCRAILTARYERHRAETEAWLRKYGVKYDRLIMAEDRDDVDAWKADALRELKASTYVESSPRRAEAIHRLWGGVVVCPPSEQMWLPSELASPPAGRGV